MIFIYHQKLGDLWCAAAMEDDRIYTTSWASDEQTVLKHMLWNIPNGAKFQVADKLSPVAEKVLAAVKLMIEGKDVSSSFKYEVRHLPQYSQRILGFLAKVPVGYVTTYGALAKAAGGGPRAVGRVMATNPFSPLIPCHRVVRSDFTVGGFGGEIVGEGVNTKLTLLQREDRGYKEATKLDVKGSVLSLFPASFARKN